MIGSFGAKDRSLHRAPGRLERALRANGIEHDVKVDADAGHSFLNNHDPAEASLIIKILAKLSGAQFHESSALDARRRIPAFFDEHLKQSVAQDEEGSIQGADHPCKCWQGIDPGVEASFGGHEATCNSWLVAKRVICARLLSYGPHRE